MEHDEVTRIVRANIAGAQAMEEQRWARLCEAGKRMEEAIANEPPIRGSRRFSLGRLPLIVGLTIVGAGAALGVSLFLNLPDSDSNSPNKSVPKHLSGTMCYAGMPNNYYLTSC